MTEVTILYDNYSVIPGLHSGWGFSCLIGRSILFDAGEIGSSLLFNMKSLGFSPLELEAVVISNDHWDHWGGLWEILEQRPGLPVYLPSPVSRELEEEIQRMGGIPESRTPFFALTPEIFISPVLEGRLGMETVREQALYISSENGFSVITGCAHPGIMEFIRLGMENFSPERPCTVLGGFHYMDRDIEYISGQIESIIRMGFSSLYPAHCSGRKAAGFAGVLPGAGFRIEV